MTTAKKSRLQRWFPRVWRFWRSHRRTCLHCGFLGYEGGEAKQWARLMVAARGADGWFTNSNAVDCYKGLWSWRDMEAGEPAYEIAGYEASRLRYRCRGYYPYLAGRGPAEHLKLEDERRDFRRKVYLWLLGAVTTAASGLIGYLLARAHK